MLIPTNHVNTHLGIIKVLLDVLLLRLARVGSVGVVNLGPVLVNVLFKSILAVLGVRDKLVLHEHGVLTLSPDGLDLLVDGGSGRDNGEFSLLDLLLDLARLLDLLLALDGVRLHGLQSSSQHLGSTSPLRRPG